MYKVILLDVDNTLLSFDEYVKQSMVSGFAHFGLGEYREEMFAVFTHINDALWRDLEKQRLNFDELLKKRWNTIFSALGITFDGELFEEYFRAQLFESAIEVEGALALLEALHGHFTLCIASNGPYQQQVNRLKIAKMLPYFEHLFISEQIGYAKPSRAFFEECLRRLREGGLDVEPHEVLMVGDSLTSDIEGGAEFGLGTCFYNPGGVALPKGIHVDYNVRMLREIVVILCESWNLRKLLEENT